MLRFEITKCARQIATMWPWNEQWLSSA